MSRSACSASCSAARLRMVENAAERDALAGRIFAAVIAASGSDSAQLPKILATTMFRVPSSGTRSSHCRTASGFFSAHRPATATIACWRPSPSGNVSTCSDARIGSRPPQSAKSRRYTSGDRNFAGSDFTHASAAYASTCTMPVATPATATCWSFPDGRPSAHAFADAASLRAHWAAAAVSAEFTSRG